MENQLVFNLQLFSEEDGYSIDDAVNMLNGTTEATTDKEEPTEQADSVEQADTQEESTEQQEEAEQSDQVEEKTEQQQPDYTTKVKFKANGQEVEKSIQELIADAQLASNYNRRMQEIAEKEKAFNTTLQQLQQQQPPQQESPADKLAKREQQIAEYAPQFEREFGVEFNQFDPAHLLEMVEHYTEKRNEEREQKKSAEYAQQQERAVEETYYSTVNSFTAEPDFAEVNKFAIDALYELPKQGAEGVKEFQKLYNIYQKTQLREQHFQETQQYGRSNVKLVPFTANEIQELTKFYNSCKTKYREKQTKSQVKAQVPKSVPIKPTIKVESVGNNDPQPARKLDMRKIREMSKDEIAKLL